MGIAEMLLSKRRQQAAMDTTQEESSGVGSSPDSASSPPTEASKSPGQIGMAAFLAESLLKIDNPMIKTLLQKMVDSARTTPEQVHAQLHLLYEKAKELIDADQRAGFAGTACSCAQSATGGPYSDLRNDGSWEDAARRYLARGLVEAVPAGEGAHSGLEATLPGTVAIVGDHGETTVPEVGHEQPA